jgi:cupin 2 domain-containing protein
MMKPENIFHQLPARLPEELFETILENSCLKLERIVSRGHVTPENKWYDQEQDEWVMVLKGKALLLFDDGSRVEMGPGDHLFIPAHKRHRVEWTLPGQETIWLALHTKEAKARKWSG